MAKQHPRYLFRSFAAFGLKLIYEFVKTKISSRGDGSRDDDEYDVFVTRFVTSFFIFNPNQLYFANFPARNAHRCVRQCFCQHTC